MFIVYDKFTGAIKPVCFSSILNIFTYVMVIWAWFRIQLNIKNKGLDGSKFYSFISKFIMGHKLCAIYLRHFPKGIYLKLKKELNMF